MHGCCGFPPQMWIANRLKRCPSPNRKIKTLPTVIFLFIVALAATSVFGEEIDHKTAQAIKTVDSCVLTWQYTENPYSAKTPPSLRLAVGDLIKLRFYDRPVSTANDHGSMDIAITEFRCPGSVFFKVPKEGVKWANKLITSGSRQAQYVFCRVTRLKEKLSWKCLVGNSNQAAKPRPLFGENRGVRIPNQLVVEGFF